MFVRLWLILGLAEKFELNITAARRGGFIRIGDELNQLAAQNVIPVFGFGLSRTAIKTTFEFKPDSVQRPGCKRDVVSLHRCLAEELVKESAAIAINISAPRNVSGNAAFLKIDLNKFTIAQEAVHAGYIFVRLAGGRLVCRRG